MRAATRMVLLASFLSLVGCGDGTTEAVPQKAVVTAASSSIDLAPGASSYIVFSIARTAGHSGDVNLTIANLPTGVTATFHPPTVVGGALVSSLQITIAPQATPGSYTLVATASGSGVEPAAIPLTLRVLQPGISLSAGAASVDVEQTDDVSVPVTIVREGGFAGVVGLSAVGLPAGVSAVFAPATLQNGQTTATLTLSASLDAIPGSSTITVQAASAGITSKSVSVQLTVTPTTTPAVTVVADPAYVEIIRGQSRQSTVSISRIAGYNGEVSIAATDLPANVTASAMPIAVGQSSTVLTINTSVDAVPGLYTVPLRATGTGIEAATAGITVRVLDLPGFRFSFVTINGPTTPTGSLTLPRGAVRYIGPQLIRISGYSEEITIELEGVPAGVSMSMELSSTGAPQFQFTASDEAVPGNYTLTLRGTGADGLVVETSIFLTIT